MKKVLILTGILLLAQTFLFSAPLHLYDEMTVSENLRLREFSDSTSRIKTVMQAGTVVRVIKIGDKEKIDNIDGNWIKVEVIANGHNKEGKELKNGVYGWCFSGFLKNNSTKINHKLDYNNQNGTIIFNKTENNLRTIKRMHVQEVIIGDLCGKDQRSIYKKPGSESIIYTLSDNDKISISEIWYLTDISTEKTSTWFKIKVNNTEGFMCSFDPYGNNLYEIYEHIESSGRKWTVHKMNNSVAVFSKEDTVNIYEQPGNSSKIIATIPSSYKNGQGQTNIDIEAMTEEKDSENNNTYWIRTTYNGITGWISGSYLSSERGGPTYYIPSDIISFRLGWYL